MLPSTRVSKVNFKFIVENVLDKRKLWGKEWTIFEYDKVTVTMRLESINIVSNRLTLRIKLNTSDEHNSDYNYTHMGVSMSSAHENELALTKTLVANISGLVESYERKILYSYKAYNRISDMKDEQEKEVIDRANKLLDSLKIEYKAIREAYIEMCVRKFGREFRYENEFVYSKEGKVRPHYYLMLSAFFFPDDKERYQSVIDYTGIDKGTKRFKTLDADVKEYIRAVHNGEVDKFVKEMDFELEDINGDR